MITLLLIKFVYVSNSIKFITPISLLFIIASTACNEELVSNDVESICNINNFFVMDGGWTLRVGIMFY